MLSISIGQVSGLIALGVFVVQVLLSLSIVIVLVGFLRNEHNAVTWSVVGRMTQTSLWPNILRTDSVSSKRVSLRVFLLSWAVTLSLLLVAVAGVVTPLGLSDSIKAGNKVTAHFQYFPDLTGYGYGTPPRYNRISRLCGGVLLRNCPGRSDGYTTIRNATGVYGIPDNEDAIINSTIPANITEVFGSATSDDGNTLSGALDIQYRTWSVGIDAYSKQVDGGRPYAQGEFRNLEMIILDNKIEAIEGLVVDTIKGGLGFRNHTIPVGFEGGAEWSEDLTWIEPVTSCVDTNLTFLIEVGDSQLNVTEISLVDNGGFVDLSRTDPYEEEVYVSQDLDLYHRAYKGAWANNQLAMSYFNVTFPGNKGARNTSKGRRFPLPSSYSAPLSSIQLSGIDGHYMQLATTITNTSGLNLSATAATRLSVTLANFTLADLLCRGSGPGDSANISNVAINCGYLFGAPRRSDGSESLIFEPERNYTQNMYVCASAMQASVKTVKFVINGTASLANLQVESVQDKKYDGESSKPLWAVEKSGLNISDIQPLWGLVHDRHEKSENLWTLRKEKLYLPAVWTLLMMASGDSVASANAPATALGTTFGNLFSGSVKADYSGETNIALNRLWQSFSKSGSTAGNIINLITTDILAASLVGTKSAITRPDSSAIPGGNDSGYLPSNAVALVSGYRRQLQYKLIYAIPALIILLFLAVVLVAALFMWVTRRFKLAVLKQLLNQTATGRTVTNILYPELCDPQAPTSEWLDKAGGSHLAFAVVPRHEATTSNPSASASASGSFVNNSRELPKMVVEDEKQTMSRGGSTIRFGGGGKGRKPLYRVLSQDDAHDP